MGDLITDTPHSGALLLDKPTGVTSAQAVARVRRLLPPKTKVGHTGTLDPLASGLLVLLIGRGTRVSRYITGLDKVYTVTARFGAVSTTLDAEGEITPIDALPVTEEQVLAALPHFTGEITQIPPMASAVKVGGKRLYKLHRQGLEVERPPRTVTVYSSQLISFDPIRQDAVFDVSCSSGTYVRTWVSDLAASLGSGAYVTQLRRISVGHLTLRAAVAPEQLTSDNLVQCIIHTQETLKRLPKIEIANKKEIKTGQKIKSRGIKGSFRVELNGELLAIYRDEGEIARAEVVLCAE